MIRRHLRHWVGTALLCLLAACGGGGGSSAPTVPTPIQLLIATQPASLTVADGATADFHVLGSGNGALAYQWFRNGTAIVGATGANYSSSITYADNAAHFKVVISDASGATLSSSDAVLSVTPSAVTITTQPIPSLTVAVGSGVVFQVQASGTPNLTYQWEKNGTALTGQTAASLSIPSVSLSDNAASYVVKVSNPAGTVSSDAAVLTVTAIAQAPVITANPPPLVTVAVGQTANVSVTANSSQAMTYQWYANGAAISGATGAQYSIPAAAQNDEGTTFYVTVSNATGSVDSTNAILHVLAPSSIATQPQSISVVQGQAATFNVTAAGTSPFSYQWYRGGIAIGGATAASYTLASTTAADNGAAFTVKVANSVNLVTSNAATLTVTAPPSIPTITRQPANTAGRVGFTASFSVAAAGTAPLAYQWSKNGAVISGATSASYTTPILLHADNAANYTVTVSNAAGTPAVSSSATLTVIASIAQIATGYFHSLAIIDDATIWAWGMDLYGQLGVAATGITAGQAYQVQNADLSVFANAAQVAGGHSHSLARKTDGTVWAWGDGTYGVLGDGVYTGHTLAYANPVKMPDGSALGGVGSLAAGYKFSVAAKTSDGSVWAWGSNRHGKLGDGTQTDRANPVAVTLVNGSPLLNVQKVVAGGEHAAALKSDGSVWSWGDNVGGDLGNNSLIFSPRAVQVLTSSGQPLLNVVDIAAGTSHSVALTTGGTAYSWGDNTNGALGDGTTNARTQAVLIKDASGNPISGISKIAAGLNTTLLLMVDGRVLTVGENIDGQLGTGSMAPTYSLSPVAANISGVTSVAMTFGHALAIRNDGSLWAWGLDNTHQLGDLGQVSTFQPMPTRINGL